MKLTTINMLISQLSYLTNPIKHRPNYEKRHQRNIKQMKIIGVLS